MDCEFGHQSSWLEKIGVNVKSCPDSQYCCDEDDRVYCCSSSEFVSNSFAGLLPILVAVAVGFLIVCCLCCLCCPCCLLYKRRHRGTVYGRVQTVVTTPQPAQQQAPVCAPQPTPMPMPMPGYSQTTGYPMYTAQAGQQPPPYSEVTASEVYAKQAPYNPSFQ